MSRADSLVVEEQGWWRRRALDWHAVFTLNWLLVLGILLVTPTPAVAFWLLGALAAWYAVFGVLAFAHSRRPPYSVVYLVGVYLLFALLVYRVEQAMPLLFVLYPQSYAMVEGRLRQALVVTGFTGSYVLAGCLRDEWRSEQVLSHVLMGAVSLGFSLAIGAFIGSLFDRSAQRIELIRALDATRARLAAAHHEAGVLAERERLAREIHDTVAQGLTSLIMLLQAADPELESDPAAARRRLALAERTARESLAETRALLTALDPAQLSDARLDEALARLVERFGEETEIAAAFSTEGIPRPLDANSQIVLLRVTQEALANARRHSGASRVGVELVYRPDRTVLVVRDNGGGFEPGQAEGFGLRSLRGRVAQVSGEVEVESAPGAGTRVRVVLTRPQQTAAADRGGRDRER